MRKSNVGRKSIPLTEDPKITTEQAHTALLFIEDVFDRALMPFILLDELAQQILENKVLDVCEISVGVREMNLTEYGRGVLMAYMPRSEWTKTTIYYEHEGVPIIIWRIHNDLEVFKHPDQVHYSIFDLYVPNPFKEYWKNRDLIK